MRIAIAVLMLAVSAPAAAQAPADLMAGCIGIARDADRLACFDAALAKVSPQARAASEARAVETARLKAAEAAAEAEAKRDSFGAEGVAARGEKRFAPPPGEMQEVETAITEVLTNSSGLGVFLLENGQLWKQADTARLPNVRVGDRVKLTRGPLGGYKLNFLKQKGWVLVKRVR